MGSPQLQVHLDFKCIIIARYIMCQTSLHELDCVSVAQDFSSKDMTQQVSNATVTVQSLENDSTDAWLKPSCLRLSLYPVSQF